MNTSEIEVLLVKYYEGNTTLAEEKCLRDFFRGREVPASLKSHQPLFVFFGDEQHREITDPDFNKESTEKLEQLEVQPGTKRFPGKSRLLYITGIAASFLLLAGIFLAYRYERHDILARKKASFDTELAYNEASQALLMVSSNLNTGIKQINRLQMIDRAMSKVQLFNKFYQYQTIIINPDELQNQSIK